MDPFPETEDESFIDKLESKNRQLIFLYGSEENEQKRKLLEQQITQNNRLIKKLEPYQRYGKLKNEQQSLRIILEKTQNTLNSLKSELNKAKRQNQDLVQVKEEYLKLMEQIAKGKQYEYKIKALNKQIQLIEGINESYIQSTMDNTLETLSTFKKQLMDRKAKTQAEKANVVDAIRRYEAQIQYQSQEWKNLFSKKSQLQSALNSQKTKRIALQDPVHVSKASSRAKQEQQRQSFQIRKKKVNYIKVEQKKEWPTCYIAWTVLLLVWLGILVYLAMGRRQRAIQAVDEICY